MSPIHGYWSIRGFAQPIRFLLAYTGTEYEDKRYHIHGEAPNFDRSEWTNEKWDLGLDFPNLPYFMDGELKLTQSFAILKYLARKHGLSGVTDDEKIRLDLIEAEANDLRYKWVVLCYLSDYEKTKNSYVEQLVAKVGEFAKFIGNRPWFAGERVTYMDFVMYELLDQHLFLEPKLLDEHANLKAFQERFRSLPAIADYMKSDQFIAYPVYGPMAKFGEKRNH